MSCDPRRFRLMVLAFALALFAGCSHSGALAGARDPAAGASEYLELTIANAADTSMVLPGAIISLITTGGDVEELGETDRLGTIKIPKRQLQADEALLVTACSRWFFCGAIYIERTELTKFDEYFLTLAPITVRSD